MLNYSMLFKINFKSYFIIMIYKSWAPESCTFDFSYSNKHFKLCFNLFRESEGLPMCGGLNRKRDCKSLYFYEILRKMYRGRWTSSHLIQKCNYRNRELTSRRRRERSRGWYFRQAPVIATWARGCGPGSRYDGMSQLQFENWREGWEEQRRWDFYNETLI